MTHTPHTWPGMSKPVYLPDDIPVEVKIITNSRFRSTRKSNAHVKTTWHDTGNPNTRADGEWTWANNGRQGAGVGGYNAIFDDRKIIICQPFDEDVWAAGTALGNHTSYHAEQAWGGGTNFARSLEIGATLHGGIIAAKGWEADTALVQHHVWYGKHCPGQIRNRGLWPTVVKMVSDAARAARLAASGGDSSTPIAYDPPSSIPELAVWQGKDANTVPYRLTLADGTVCVYVGDRVRTVRETPRMRYSEGAARVGPPLKPGETFGVDWLLQHPDRPDIYLTPWLTRIKAADTERVSDLIEQAA